MYLSGDEFIRQLIILITRLLERNNFEVANRSPDTSHRDHAAQLITILGMIASPEMLDDLSF